MDFDAIRAVQVAREAPLNYAAKQAEIQQAMQQQAMQQQAMQQQQMQQVAAQKQQQQEDIARQQQAGGLAAYLNAVRGRSSTMGAPSSAPGVKATPTTPNQEPMVMNFDTVSQSILKNNPNIKPEEFAVAVNQFKPQFDQEGQMQLKKYEAELKNQSTSTSAMDRIYNAALKGESPEETRARETYMGTKRAIGDEVGDTAAQKYMGKEAVAIHKSINDAADNATLGNTYLDRVESLAGDIQLGRLAPVKEALSSWAQSAGLMTQEQADDTFGSAGSAQALAKVVVPMVTTQLKQLSSRPAVMEFQAFLKANPNIEMTPDGLAKVVQFARKANNIAIEKQNTFEDWAQGKKPSEYSRFSSYWNKQQAEKYAGNNVNGTQEQQPKTNMQQQPANNTPAQINTAEQWQSLPSGSTYVDPQGNTRKKP